MAVSAVPTRSAHAPVARLASLIRLRPLTAGTVERMGRSETRVVRVIALGFLPAGAVFGLLATPALVAQSQYFPPLWTVAVLVGQVGSALAMGAVSLVAPIRVLRALATICTVSCLAAVATVPLIANAWTAVWPIQPWVQLISALGAIAAVMVWRPVVCTAIAAAISLLTALDRIAAGSAALAGTAVDDGLYLFLFCVTFIALGLRTLATARDVDAAQSDALRAATQTASELARERERSRINALVHDRVLATLLGAARATPGAATLGQADAARALADLRALLSDGPVAAPLTGQELVWALQSSTTEIAPESMFGYEVHAERTVPSDVVEAVTAALEEALRNSVLHAGEANRTVHVQIDGDAVRVEVLDDGRGFDTARIPPERLGISESIRGRMTSLPGGEAAVISTEGVGTRVRLTARIDSPGIAAPHSSAVDRGGER